MYGKPVFHAIAIHGYYRWKTQGDQGFKRDWNIWRFPYMVVPKIDGLQGNIPLKWRGTPISGNLFLDIWKKTYTVCWQNGTFHRQQKDTKGYFASTCKSEDKQMQHIRRQQTMNFGMQVTIQPHITLLYK